MNTQETLQLAGIYRPRQHGPGFGIPVFSHEGQYWVQEVFNEDRVRQFVTCDVEEHTLRMLPSPPDPPRQSVGQQALYAFEATDGTIKLGVREEVGKWLQDRLAELHATPFILYDVAEFLGDSDLIIEAQEGCDALMQQSRKVAGAPAVSSETTGPTYVIQELPHLLDLIDALLQETRGHALREEQDLFGCEVAAHTLRFVGGLNESTEAFCNRNRQVLAPAWQEARAGTEALERGVRLANPALEEDFRANLFWMAERGKENDLNLLQRLKKNPPYTSDEILQLLGLAIQRIGERTRHTVI